MKNNKKIIIMFIIIGVLLFEFLGYKVYNDFFSSKDKTKLVDSIDLYGYTLDSTDSDLFKSEFEILRKTLNEDSINYEEYAKSISKLFIIDLYTINNKKGSTDIGGTEFIFEDLKENFKENMGATLYRNVETNIYGNRTQKLPIVSEITVDSIEKSEYIYNDTKYDGYTVLLSWKYKEDLGYQSSIKLTLIESNKKLYIVKGE